MFNARFEDLTIDELKEIYMGLGVFSEKMVSWLSYFNKSAKEYMKKDWNEKEGINRTLFFDYSSKKDGVEFIQDDFNHIFKGYL